MITATEKVQATAAEIWAVLLERVEHAEEFMPAVLAAEIIGRKDNEVIRKLYTEGGEVTERVIMEEEKQRMSFHLVKHPFFKGLLVQQIEEKEDGVYLTFMQEWTPKESDEDMSDFGEIVAGALKELVMIIEGTEA